MKILHIALLALTIGTTFAQTSQREFTAPDAKSTVRILEKPMAGADVLLDSATVPTGTMTPEAAEVKTAN